MYSSMKMEIIELEERLRMAMLSSDIAVLSELLSQNLLFTNHLGQIISKNDDLEAHRTKDFIFDTLTLRDQVIKFSGEVAIVSTHTEISGSYKGSPTSGDFRFTRVWAKEKGEWKISAGHSSVMA